MAAYLGRELVHRNVVIVQAMYEAFARRDQATLVSHLDPAMRVYDRPLHPEASVYEGVEGFLRFAVTDWPAFDEVSYEPQDFLVWKLRDGRCVELRNYSTLDEALQAIEPE
jgi:ketosteroid isomerase-like protein